RLRKKSRVAPFRLDCRLITVVLLLCKRFQVVYNPFNRGPSRKRESHWGWVSGISEEETMTNRRTAIGVPWCGFVCACLMISAAHAQVSTTGEIRGTVMDPGGAVVPGADLKLENQAAGASRNAVSSADGGFVFVRVEPGTYRLVSTAKGFQTIVTAGI